MPRRRVAGIAGGHEVIRPTPNRFFAWAARHESALVLAVIGLAILLIDNL